MDDKKEALFIIEKDIGELSKSEQEALRELNTVFDVIIKHNKDIDEILNCEFCMDGQ